LASGTFISINGHKNPAKTNLQMGIKMISNGHIIQTLDPVTTAAEDLFALGMEYCMGKLVPQNYIEAHKWFNIAALKGNESAKLYRCEISREMSPSQIAEAQRQGRAAITLH
jgi:uncharacterized protein